MSPERWRTARPMARLREGRTDWYSIKALADGPTAVYIYDEVGYFGITAQDFIRDLTTIAGDVELHLSTPGGEVFDGIAIHAALKQRAGNVAVVVDSLAASIGSVIAMAASPGQLSIMPNASVMIHDGFGLVIGNAADMREQADLLDRVSDNIASIYATRTGKPKDDWRKAMLAETWYFGQEAVDAGLADRVAQSPAKTAQPDGDDEGENSPRKATSAHFDLSIFRNTPERLKNLRNQADPATPDPVPDAPQAGSPPTEPEAVPTEAPAENDRGFVVPEAETQGEPGPEPEALPSGQVVEPESATDAARLAAEVLALMRDGFKREYGRNPTPLGMDTMPLLDKAITVHHTDTVDTAWDGPAAVKAMPAEYADLHYCHAWQSADADSSSHTPGDDDEDDKKGEFKFPHHAKKGGPANLAACRNGLARLDGSSIPDADKPGVKAHLQAHLDDANGDDDSSSNHSHDDFQFTWDPSMTAALKEAMQ